MEKTIEQYAEERDLKSLKNIFVDSLDIDPTFEMFEKDYSYCKSIPGLLEQHRELTPFETDSAHWTEEYWTKLKVDLKKNFSDQRMTHMRKVAKVFLAEKVKRLQAERQAAAASSAASAARPAKTAPVSPSSSAGNVRHAFPTAAEQAKGLEEEKKQLAAEKMRKDEEEKAQERRLARKRAEIQQENQLSQQQTGGTLPKKAWGAAGIILLAVLALTILFLLWSRSPEHPNSQNEHPASQKSAMIQIDLALQNSQDLLQLQESGN